MKKISVNIRRPESFAELPGILFRTPVYAVGRFAMLFWTEVSMILTRREL